MTTYNQKIGIETVIEDKISKLILRVILRY